MNQDLNNQNSFNTQDNSEMSNNQPLQNNQGLNNTFNQNKNVSQQTFNNQPQVNMNYQQLANQHYEFSNYENGNQPKNKIRKVKWIIIFVIAIILLVAGVVIYKIGFNNKSNNINGGNGVQNEETTNATDLSKNLEEEYNKKVDENYLKTLKFEVLDIVKVDSSHSGYSSFEQDVTRVVFYIKNGLRLSHTNGYNGYWDGDLKVITKDNIQNDGTYIYPIEGTYDAILITYFKSDSEFGENDFTKKTTPNITQGVAIFYCNKLFR